MKKVSFLVAFLAILQIITGIRVANAQERIRDRRTVEEALDRAGDEVGEELEAIFEQLGQTAEKMGHSLERWAEENSEELEAWSEKYGEEWESWSNRLAQKMERLGEEQEFIWSQWAERYERDLDQWSSQLDIRSEFDSDAVGELVERNLEMLSKMPLGQLVDEVLQKGVGELRDAPWDSLGELTELAADAIQEPMEELSEVLDPNGKDLDAIRRGSGEIIRSLDQLRTDVERNISDRSDVSERVRDKRIEAKRGVEAQLGTLQRLLENDKLSRSQRATIKQAINTLKDAQALRSKQEAFDELKRRVRRPADVSRRDQILEKIEREKRRHDDALRAFNDDLRKSSEQSRLEDERQNRRDREIDNRRLKRTDGKNLDQSPIQPSRAKKDPIQWLRDGGREGRADQRQRGQKTAPKKKASDNKKKPANKKEPAKRAKIKKAGNKDSEQSELEQLRRELERLRKEVQRMKEDGS